MKNMCFIINPRSGKVRIKNALLDVLQIFGEAGYRVDVRVTQHIGHAIEIAQGISDNVDVVAVSGGDGTLNEVLTGLLKSEKNIPVGYIPTGSTNDFAATFGISTEPKRAAMQLVSGERVKVDVGKFGSERYFSYIASFGMFTAVSYNTPQNVKNVFGHLAYVLEGVKDITNICPYDVTIEADGKTYEGRYIFGSITTSTSVGGIVKFDKSLVSINDGLFEIVLVKYPANIMELHKIVKGCASSDFSDDMFEFIKAKNVKLTFDKEMDWSVDGEHQKAGKIIEIENLMQAATIIR